MLDGGRGDQKISAGMAVACRPTAPAPRSAQIDREYARRIMPQHAVKPVGEALGKRGVSPLLLGNALLLANGDDA